MSPDLQKELYTRTNWDRTCLERLVASRSVGTGASFAPGSVFADGCLAPLADVSRLALVAFRDSELSRDNLLTLTRLPAVVRIDLYGCRFRADDFAAFCDALAGGGSPKLSELWLENTAVTDDDLTFIGRIERLRWLILSGTRITDAGLTNLLPLKKLETLWLERLPITDEGVLRLAALPKLTGLPTRETNCSTDIGDKLFRAQVALQKSKTPTNDAQVEAADERLREFLRAMEAWERAAYARAGEIEKEYRAQRHQPNVYSEAEGRANEIFWREINEQKAAIAERFCSRSLLARGAGRAGSYGSPPRLIAPTGDWIATETPSKTKTVFTGESSSPGDYRRYTMKYENDEWRVDEVQWWAGGWKRDPV